MLYLVPTIDIVKFWSETRHQGEMNQTLFAIFASGHSPAFRNGTAKNDQWVLVVILDSDTW